MNDRFWGAFNSFKSLTDNMLSCLSQHLDRYILRDQILLDQRTEKLILCLRSSRKSNLDLFKTNLYKKLEKFHFLLQAHRDHKCLISVTKVYRAPDRGLIHIFFLRPFHTFHRRHVILTFVLGWCHHFVFLHFLFPLKFLFGFCF